MSKRQGTIIEAYLKMWPREALNLRSGGRLPDEIWGPLRKPGVYVLYRDDQPYYIGRATCLEKRIHTHANNTGSRRYHFWNFFSAFVVPNPKHIPDVEGILIAAFPTDNSSTPRFENLRLPEKYARHLHGRRLFDV